MYGIYENNELVKIVQVPRFVYKKAKTGAWVQTEDEYKAEAIVLDGEVCNLGDKPAADENARTLFVAKIDAGVDLKNYRATIDNTDDMVLTALMAITDLYEEVTGK